MLSSLAWTSGNFDGNPTIDQGDVQIVQNIINAAVPEPASFTALAATGRAFMLRRRKGRAAMKEKSPVQRCAWAESDPIMQAYHDREWGVPQHDSRMLWEMLMLEGFQAGLSWSIILKRRDAFRKAFKGFDPKKVARFTEADVERLMNDAGIIRARAKIEATIGGAKAYLAIEKAGETFDDFAWSFVKGKPIVNTTGHVPAKTELSEHISKELKKRGFKFVGPVIVYAWMQAVGLVNDHAGTCFGRKAK